VLKFAHLISAGLAGFKFCHSAPEPLYYVFPTEKGERIIDAWFSGSMQQVRQALNDIPIWITMPKKAQAM